MESMMLSWVMLMILCLFIFSCFVVFAAEKSEIAQPFMAKTFSPLPFPKHKRGNDSFWTSDASINKLQKKEPINEGDLMLIFSDMCRDIETTSDAAVVKNIWTAILVGLSGGNFANVLAKVSLDGANNDIAFLLTSLRGAKVLPELWRIPYLKDMKVMYDFIDGCVHSTTIDFDPLLTPFGAVRAHMRHFALEREEVKDLFLPEARRDPNDKYYYSSHYFKPNKGKSCPITILDLLSILTDMCRDIRTDHDAKEVANFWGIILSGVGGDPRWSQKVLDFRFSSKPLSKLLKKLQHGTRWPYFPRTVHFCPEMTTLYYVIKRLHKPKSLKERNSDWDVFALVRTQMKHFELDWLSMIHMKEEQYRRRS